MCFGGSSSTSTSTTNSAMDPIDRQAKNIAIGRGLDIMNQSYPGYDPNQRVAGFNPSQTSAFGKVTDYSNSPVNIASERVVDESGRLGPMGDYIDPYIQNALAPAIRDMQEAGKVQRNDIGSSATMSGAFGDSRHGIAEGEQMRHENRSINDMTSQAYSNAFAQAMGLRSSDLDRFASTDVLKDQATLNRALSQLGVGDQQQKLGQDQADAKYAEFLQAREWPFRQFDLLPSIISGTPTSQTTTTKQPNNSLYNAIGSVAGSALGGYLGG